ncbi:MAG: MerC domain-containing protein [Chlorobi bacterium CHB2]|nr:MerC domain-containing protein [Chlorobi bacterium CHB2]
MAHTHAHTASRTSQLLGRLGLSASTICAIHCMAMPFLLGVLPTLGLGFLASGWFELAMIGISVVLGAITLKHRTGCIKRSTRLCCLRRGWWFCCSTFLGMNPTVSLPKRFTHTLLALGR